MPTLTAATWSYGTALTLLTTLLMKSRGILATWWGQICSSFNGKARWLSRACWVQSEL